MVDYKIISLMNKFVPVEITGTHPSLSRVKELYEREKNSTRPGLFKKSETYWAEAVEAAGKEILQPLHQGFNSLEEAQKFLEEREKEERREEKKNEKEMIKNQKFQERAYAKAREQRLRYQEKEYEKWRKKRYEERLKEQERTEAIARAYRDGLTSPDQDEIDWQRQLAHMAQVAESCRTHE